VAVVVLSFLQENKKIEKLMVRMQNFIK
jgi:hypothetical protein